MSVTYGFYDSLNGDRKYNSKQMSQLFDGIINDGVFASIGTCLMVTAEGTKTIKIGTGRAWFNSTWTNNDALHPILVPDSEVILNRIDAVVLEIGANIERRTNSFKIIKGVPATNPVRPTLANTEGSYQHPLAYISVKAGVTSINQADVTNVIGTTQCPFVTGILQTLSVDALIAQWNGEYSLWFNSLNTSSSALTKQWTDSFDKLFTDSTIDMTNYKDTMMSEFNIWFDNAKDVLDGDVAGNLLILINELSENSIKMVVHNAEPVNPTPGMVWFQTGVASVNLGDVDIPSTVGAVYQTTEW